MKSALYIKLVFVTILTLALTPALAENTFSTFVCYTFVDPHPTRLCGFGDSPEEAAGDFCLKRYGVNNGVGFKPREPRYQCFDVDEPSGFAQCRPSAITCNSTPPATPLESYYYKPLDGIDQSSPFNCGVCACEGEQWTLVNKPGLVGCLAPKPSEDKPCDNPVGNPCNPANGDKYAREVDFSNDSLSFIRYYSTGNLSDYGLGMGWTSNHHQRLVMSGNGDELTQVSSNGRGEPWRSVNNTWVGHADTDILLEKTNIGFKVTMANSDVENYSESGLLLSKVDTNGLITRYQYNDDQKLERVTNHYGHSISFTYELDRISTVTDPQGAVYTYEYSTAQILIAVVHPDTTPTDGTDNPRRKYLYTSTYDIGKVLFLPKLSGIVDENGDRYSFYGYHADGRARSTSHASTNGISGQEQFILNYQEEN